MHFSGHVQLPSHSKVDMIAVFKKYPPYKFVLAGLDWLTCNVAFVIALQARNLRISGELFGAAPLFEELTYLLVCGGMTVFVFQYFHLYKTNVFITLVYHAVQVAKAQVFIVISLALLSFFTKSLWALESRLLLVYYGVAASFLFLTVRVLIFRKLFLWFSRQRIYQRKVLIVGSGMTGKNLAVNLFLHPHAGCHVVGFIDDEMQMGKRIFGNAKVIGRIEELVDCIKIHEVNEAIICLENTSYARLMEVMELAVSSGVSVKISSPLYDVIPSRILIEQYGDVPVVSVSQAGPSPVKERYKRIFDTVLAVIGIILLLPLLTVIAVIIKLDSSGPVFFRQIRIGKNGVPFTFYKFRSMQLGSDQDQMRKDRVTAFIKTKRRSVPSIDQSTKIVNESRVTRSGRWLRRLSLDELPQLLNVVKGDMSLVGPRPCLPYEWEHYEDWHKRRLSVLPGCTGIWQVSGRSVVGFEDMVVLDLYYIQNASVFLDVRLLLKTIPVMLLGIGAK